MADEKDAASKGGKNKKKALITVAIVAGVMLAEGGAVFMATRWLSPGPDPAAAAMNGLGEEAPAAAQDVEIEIADFMAPNAKKGRVFVYEMKIAARVAGSDVERLKVLLKEQRLTISDRLNNLVRAADPQILTEDGLETLKRQMRFEINNILGDEDLIRMILIPKLMPHRAD